VKVCSGKDYKHLGEGDIPVYGTGGYMLSVSEALSDQDAIGIGRKGTIDNPYILKAPFWTVDTLFYCVPKDSDLNFVYGLYQTINWRSMDESTGVPSLSKTAINDVDVCVPSIDEQKRIGATFHKLDAIITLHQCMHYPYQICRRRYESISFYRHNTTAWEQRKVKEVCSISTGKSNTQDKVDDGVYPFYVRSPIIEHSNKYLFDEEAVLTVGDGVGTGKVFHYVNGKYDLHQRVYRLFGFADNVDAKYFYHWFSSHFYDRVMSMTAKTSVDSVRLEMIADMTFVSPNIEEQQNIASVLSYLDDLITLHQCKHYPH
jgi:type I restriction enzyme S subunit